MADPLGYINRLDSQSTVRRMPTVSESPSGETASFKDVMKAGIAEVNRAQQEATRAVEDLAGGQRADVEGVLLATQKADNAFRMLQSLRNRMVEAYDEIKQMRV